jgi:hypothetical protein
MAEDTGFFTDRRQIQYMATPRFAMGKKQDVNGLLKRFSGWLWCPLALFPRNLWQMVYNLPKISSLESFWVLEMFKYLRVSIY